MIPLKKEFGFAGHRLHQTWRKDDIALYERSICGKAPHEYELIIIRIKPPSEFKGIALPERETYPTPSEWGTYGWSFPVRYKEMVFDLSENILGISKHRPGFVRHATSQFKDCQQNRYSCDAANMEHQPDSKSDQ
jgi:hypothetical protein